MRLEHKLVPRIEQLSAQNDFYKDFYNSPIYKQALKHFAKDWYTSIIKEIEVKIEGENKNAKTEYLEHLYKLRQLYIKSLNLFGISYIEPKKITNPYKK